LPRSGSLSEVVWPHLCATTCSCRRHRRFEQVAQTDQVVSDHVQAKYRTDVFGAAQLELAQAAPLLDPAKHLLDAAACVDRFGVALVAGGAPINGGTARAGGVLSDVRCHSDPPEFGNQSPGVVVLVGTDGFLVGTGDGRRHRFGGIPLAGAHRLGEAAVHDQRMAVVHQHMAPVAGQCWMGVGLAGQQSVRIDAGAVGLVAELDAPEIPFGPFLAGLWSAKTLART